MSQNKLDDIGPVTFEWAADGLSIGVVAQELDNVLATGITTISNAAAIPAAYTISNSAGFAFNNINGKPHINIRSDDGRAMIETTKHDIDVDKLYEDVKDLKQVLVALANDSDLLERNPIIRDILAEWLIKGLTK